MCQYFSLVTSPEDRPGERFYFDWSYRKDNLAKNDADHHDHIIGYYNLDDKKCNKYEYNPLTKDFTIDGQNSTIDDRVQVEEWLHSVNWKRIVKPLVIKPIINPFEMPAVGEVTDEHIQWLHEWASVWDSVRASVWDSVRASVRDSVRDSVLDSVWDSVYAYISSFIAIEYTHDYTSAIKLWEVGLVPSFDGTTWRLHTGKDAHVVYEMEVK